MKRIREKEFVDQKRDRESDESSSRERLEVRGSGYC